MVDFFTTWIVSFYVFTYFVERFILESFRGDSPRYGHLTGGQWSAMAIVALDLVFMIYLAIRDRKTRLETPNEV
jgi:phosphatidylglycerol---prolipoprotein diacylglyceryl transferase